MQNIKKGDLVKISHRFDKIGYEIIGTVVTPGDRCASASLPFMEVWNKKEKRIYLKNILGITLVEDGQEVNIK